MGDKITDDDDYIKVNNFGDYTNALTAEAWVYRDATTIINIFCEGGHYDASDWILYLRTASTTEGIDFGVNNHASYVRKGSTPQNCWFYLTATYNAGNVILYVNGTQVGSGTSQPLSTPTMLILVLEMITMADNLGQLQENLMNSVYPI